MRAAARNAPQVRRPSVSAAGGNLEIGRIHFGRFESDHGVPGESGAFCGASSSIKPDRVRGVIFAMVIAPFLGVLVWRRKNKRSRPLALGRERLPLRGATQIQGPAGLLLPPVVRGGCRGRLRPRSARRCPSSRPAGPLSAVRPSLWGRRLEYCCGIRAVSRLLPVIVCVFGENVKRWGGWRD